MLMASLVEIILICFIVFYCLLNTWWSHWHRIKRILYKIEECDGRWLSQQCWEVICVGLKHACLHRKPNDERRRPPFKWISSLIDMFRRMAWSWRLEWGVNKAGGQGWERRRDLWCTIHFREEGGRKWSPSQEDVQYNPKDTGKTSKLALWLHAWWLHDIDEGLCTEKNPDRCTRYRLSLIGPSHLWVLWQCSTVISCSVAWNSSTNGAF